MTDWIREVEVIRIRAGQRSAATDRAAVEEPLEVRLHGRPFAVIMRTPGADRELAAGFLLSERIIRTADDLGAIEHCVQPADGTADSPESAGNVVNVTLVDAGRLDVAFSEKRQVTTNSSCGLCGRRTIESLTVDVRPLPVSWAVPASALLPLPARLRAAQSVFDETGGLHAAGLFDLTGNLIETAEDVGRHNAVDKVIGRMLMRDATPLSTTMLLVSGRSSFEIVQKALFAQIPLVAAVSAPSSLAVELAAQMGITLAGFVRGDSFNVYTHAERIESP
jgi:FdhD protein